MSKNKVMKYNDFYCLNCGNRSMTLPRTRGFLHEKGHRKKLWCCQCGKYLNHIEVNNDEEAFEFKEAFERGDFMEEAAESIEHCKENV